MRFERKYVIKYLCVADLQQLIRLHPASFRVHYPPRQVNNIYFDTVNYSAYQDNLKGIGQRKKVRLRWYGDSSFSKKKVRLEEKVKAGLLGYKITHDLLQPSADHFLLDLGLPDFIEHRQLIPSLFNSYHRQYYISADQKFRITIDTNQAFGTPSKSSTQKVLFDLPDEIILELKYEEEDAKSQDFVTQHLPFRLHKHSKYVTGIELITG